MPTSNTDAQVRQFDTLFSPLETQEQPAWLQQASPEQRRQLHQYQVLGRLARRRATQAFAQVQSLYTYNLLDLSAKDFATVTAQVLHRVQQRRSLDEVYLTYLHYKTYTDFAYSSFCALSKTINCDTVAQSPWSVAAGLPVSVWGIFGYLLLLLIFFLAKDLNDATGLVTGTLLTI